MALAIPFDIDNMQLRVVNPIQEAFPAKAAILLVNNAPNALISNVSQIAIATETSAPSLSTSSSPSPLSLLFPPTLNSSSSVFVPLSSEVVPFKKTFELNWKSCLDSGTYVFNSLASAPGQLCDILWDSKPVLSKEVLLFVVLTLILSLALFSLFKMWRALVLETGKELVIESNKSLSQNGESLLFSSSDLDDVNAVLHVKLLSGAAVMPTRASFGAAGYDLSSAETCVIPARDKRLVRTDLAISVPRNTYGRIAPRSGLASKHFLDVGAGVVDWDYTGPVGVLLFNHSSVDYAVKQGDRIAQFIIEQIQTLPCKQVEELPHVTTRGSSGFGSTG